ncbi:L-rhamnose-binding lectin CSL1-like [Mya arenaria]|uniref:L-rhamnose-binding lectin CSL1-like n=1 Tax=Mya arenaria TaxID=6604 RepID=UPI0022DF6888|nr:L-rhamnose-binding lectin CSL1-like [Mya arenaria]
MTTSMRHLVWSSFLMSCLVNECLSLVCLNCSSTLSPRDCTDVTTCASNEVCFADILSTADGIKHVYGCRSAMQCGVAIVGKRSNSNCSQCCQGDLCNAFLCGETDGLTTSGPVCYSCGERPNSDGCSKIRQCDRDQVCELYPSITSISHRLVYSTDCQSRTICESRIKATNSFHPGNVCGSICCDTNLCNKANCANTTITVSGDAIICEGSSGYIQCPPGKKIAVSDAYYGRTNDGSVCPFSSIFDLNCRAADSFTKINNTCSNKQQCFLTATNAMYGDPCSGTYKYIEVKFTCVVVV